MQVLERCIDFAAACMSHLRLCNHKEAGRHPAYDPMQVLERCVDFAAACKSPAVDSAAAAAEAVSLLRAEALRLAAGELLPF